MYGKKLAHTAANGNPIESRSISISLTFSLRKFCVHITSLAPQSNDFFIPALLINPNLRDNPDATDSVLPYLPNTNQSYTAVMLSCILPLRLPLRDNP